MASPFNCQTCGNDTFQEVGSVVTTTPVLVAYGDDDKTPQFVDYAMLVSDAIWDCSEGYYIECAACNRPVAGIENFKPSLTPQDALRQVHAQLDNLQPWSPDTLDAIAEVIRAAGFTIRDPELGEPIPFDRGAA